MTFDSIQPLALETAPERIADQIRSSILDGSLAPGTQLTEVQLAERLAVSRGPVREAMQRLIQEGLLRAERHRGVFVMELDSEDVNDIFLARRAVERAVVAIVLDRDHDDVVEHLRTCVAEMRAAEGDWKRIVDADLRFHEELVEAAGSKRLSRMFHTLIAETRLCIMGMQDSYPEWTELVDEHNALLAAIEKGSTDEVLALLDEHLILSRRKVSQPGSQK